MSKTIELDEAAYLRLEQAPSRRGLVGADSAVRADSADLRGSIAETAYAGGIFGNAGCYRRRRDTAKSCPVAEDLVDGDPLRAATVIPAGTLRFSGREIQ